MNSKWCLILTAPVDDVVLEGGDVCRRGEVPPEAEADGAGLAKHLPGVAQVEALRPDLDKRVRTQQLWERGQEVENPFR